MNCDPIAGAYRWFEYIGFGRALKRRREAFLNEVGDARRVLVLGDGDGRALAALLRANREATVDYVDLSARMLELARGRAGSERVIYHRADALTIPLAQGEYDLIVTHFFLDCFEESDLRQLTERIGRAAGPRARWLVSEFRKPGILVGLLYLFFRITTGLKTRRLVDHHAFLRRCGFRLSRAESAWFGHFSSELWTRAVYFTEYGGQRGAIMIVNVEDASKLPSISEPWFWDSMPHVEFYVVMTPEDLAKSGLEALGKKWA